MTDLRRQIKEAHETMKRQREMESHQSRKIPGAVEISQFADCYGRLFVAEEGGCYWWSMCDESGHNWREIHESLFRELVAHESDPMIANRASSRIGSIGNRYGDLLVRVVDGECEWCIPCECDGEHWEPIPRNLYIALTAFQTIDRAAIEARIAANE